MIHSIFEKDFVHTTYDTIAEMFHHTRFCHWNAIQEFLDSLPAYSWVLDNGCGNGKYLGYRNDLVFVGSDMCLPLLNISYRKSDVTYANSLELPYKNKMFDAIICVAVLHHLSTPERRHEFIHEMVRTMKVNGRGIVTVWALDQTNNKRMLKWNIQPNGDAMIPWKDHKGNIVSQRYYHLFTQQELQSYFEHEHIKIVKCFFEYENWCIEFQRIK